MMRNLAIAFAAGLCSVACTPAGSHAMGTYSFTSTPAVLPTLSGAAPISLFACPYWHREGKAVEKRTLVALGANCVLRGEPVHGTRTMTGSKFVQGRRTMTGSKIDPGQACTVPLDGKLATILVRDGRMESRGSFVEVNLGGTTTVDGISRYVAFHFSGDETSDAEEGECEAYLHPDAASGS